MYGFFYESLYLCVVRLGYLSARMHGHAACESKRADRKPPDGGSKRTLTKQIRHVRISGSLSTAHYPEQSPTPMSYHHHPRTGVCPSCGSTELVHARDDLAANPSAITDGARAVEAV